MSKRSVSIRETRRCFVPWCLLLVSAGLIMPLAAVSSQPADVPSVKIEVAQKAYLGQPVEVGITWTNDDSTFEIGGFDLLMEYDAAAFVLLGAELGQLPSDCDWEYFAYRYGAGDTCGRLICPSGTVRLVAVADINNGPIYPSCYANSSGELARLQFYVTNDSTLDCQFVPIRFIWYDCGDNAFSSKIGDSLFISNDVYDYIGYYEQINQDSPFPTHFGAPDSCVDTVSIRIIDFYNGGIDIICSDSLGDRGDINLNGQPNEVADWVLFTNYFLYGLEVFTVDEELQVQATDVNADGVTLTLDDLVYLWRITIGDALPYPKLGESSLDTAVFIQDATSKLVSISYPDSLTAAYLVLRGNIVPTSLVAELDLFYHFDGVHTRVLAFPSDEVFSDSPPVFAPGSLLTYTGNGLLEEAYTSDYGLLRIETSILLNGYPGSHTDISPDTISAYWSYLPDTTVATVRFGDFTDRDVTDIDQVTIHVNDTITTISAQVLSGWPGFTGQVMEITFSAGELVQGYLPIFDTAAHTYMVSGEFFDSSPFTVFGEMTIGGLLVADVDFDGQVNFADLTFLVDYLFLGGAAPPVMETADVNADGAVNIADVTTLVVLLFR